MTELGKCITLGLIGVVMFYLSEHAEEWPGLLRGLFGVVGVACLVGALFYAFAWLIDLGTLMFDRVQRSRAMTERVVLADKLRDLQPAAIEYMRQHGQFDILAYLDMPAVRYVFRCSDGHEIPLYDPEGNDLQNLLADMSGHHPNLKPIREYGNNSIMQKHARSFAYTVSRHGRAEIWGANQAARWRDGWSAARMLEELTQPREDA